MILSAAKTALKRYGFDDNDPLSTWINAGLHDFELAHNWNFLSTLATLPIDAGGEVDLSSIAVGKFLMVKPYDVDQLIDDSSPMKFLSFVDFERYVDTRDTGIPTAYTLYSTASLTTTPIDYTMRVDKQPVGWTTPQVRIFYKRQIGEPVNSTDVFMMPERYTYGPILAAARHGLLAENEEERALTLKEEFDDFVARCITDDSVTQAGELDTVRDVVGYGDDAWS